MNDKGIIIGGGSTEGIDVRSLINGRIIIAADGGCDILTKLGMEPDYLLGDLDSIEHVPISSKIDIKKYPPEKDKTDMELSVDLAVELGIKDLIIIGALGGRADHSLANIYLLKSLTKNIKVSIVDQYNNISILDGTNTIADLGYKYFSIVPIYDDTIITILGAKYELNNTSVSIGETITISNEFVDSEVTISSDKKIILIQSN